MGKYKAGLSWTLSSQPKTIFSTNKLWLFKLVWPLLKRWAKYKKQFLRSRGTPKRMP